MLHGPDDEYEPDFVSGEDDPWDEPEEDADNDPDGISPDDDWDEDAEH